MLLLDCVLNAFESVIDFAYIVRETDFRVPFVVSDYFNVSLFLQKLGECYFVIVVGNINGEVLDDDGVISWRNVGVIALDSNGSLRSSKELEHDDDGRNGENVQEFLHLKEVWVSSLIG